MTKQEDIQNLIERGVVEIIGLEQLQEKLKGKKKLRIKLGIDPTSPNLHLGRAVQILKLRDFQKLGHQIVFIVGDFTGVIGDTSDKESERPMLSVEKVKENMKTYIDQLGMILDISKCEIYYNSEWLSNLTYKEVAEQANIFSLAEFIARDNIAKRLESGTRVSLREVLYPLMQGYDSVQVKADVEIGGTDQRFNLLAGRKMQQYFGQESQAVVMSEIIEGLDGRKMSSSWGNTVNLVDSPDEMYGKIMSLTDELVIKYFKLATRVPLDVIDQYEKDVKKAKLHPRDLKMILALEITNLYHGTASAKQAQDNFVQIFQKHQKPTEVPTLKLDSKNTDIISVLIKSGAVSSRNEAKRTIDQNGIKINDQIVSGYDVAVSKGDVIQKGKRFFIKAI